MIEEIALRNFKALEDTGPVRLGPITLLVGPNSSGKSSLIQALLAGRQTAQPGAEGALVLSDGENFDLGAFTEVARRFVKPECVTVKFAGQFRPRGVRSTFTRVGPVNFLLPASGVRATLESDIRYLRKSRETYLSKLTLTMEGVPLVEGRDTISVVAEPSTPGSGRYSWTVKRSDGSAMPGCPITIRSKEQRFFDIPYSTELWGSPKFDSKTGRRLFPDAAGPLSLAYSIAQDINIELRDIRHVGAMRVEPQRSYPLKGIRSATVGQRGQRAPDIIFSESRRKKSRERLIVGLDAALKELGMSSHVLARIPSGASSFALLLDHLKPNVRVNLASVGFGVSQILPILVETYHSPPGALILLEEPEIHLHPRAQSRIADLIADAATSPTRKRFVIETHSEHFIRRLQGLIADSEHPLSKTDVNVYFFEPGTEGTQIHKLELDDNGMFTSEWPEGFFDEEVRVTALHLQAIAKNKATEWQPGS